jgi:exopolysaccharide biosynthesis polyprenyl glycosylphosphotransferase
MAIRAAASERLDHGDIITIPVAVPRVVEHEHTFRRVLLPKLILGAADLLAVVTAMYLAYRIGRVGSLPSPVTAGDYVMLTLVTLPAWSVLFARYGLYASRRITGRLREFSAVFHAVFAASAIVAVAAYSVKLDVARRWVLFTFLFALVAVYLEREVARRVFARLRRAGRHMRRVIIVGANDEGRSIAEMCEQDPSVGYKVLGFVDDHASSNGINVLGRTDQLFDVIENSGASGVIIATTALDVDTSNRVARELSEGGVHVELSSSLRDIASARLLVRPIGRFPVVYLEPVRRDGWRSGAKRAFDVVIAGGGLVLLAPLLALIALAIKIDSRGPVLFSQVRIGRDGKPFTIRKFRTMVVDAEAQLADLRALNEADGPMFKMRDDPRVTRVGKLLRSISFDELPQLWNVLRNEMTMVGPRPALPAEVLSWDPKIRQRLRVKPGLTGMWQVNGRSDTSFEDYVRLDLYYVDNWSLVTDLAIILRTIPTMLRRDGAY